MCDTLDGHDLTWTGKEPKGKFNRMLSPEERRELLESVVYGETLEIAERLEMNYMMIAISRINGDSLAAYRDSARTCSSMTLRRRSRMAELSFNALSCI